MLVVMEKFDDVLTALFLVSVAFFLGLGFYMNSQMTSKETQELIQYLDTPECSPPDCIRGF